MKFVAFMRSLLCFQSTFTAATTAAPTRLWATKTTPRRLVSSLLSPRRAVRTSATFACRPTLRPPAFAHCRNMSQPHGSAKATTSTTAVTTATATSWNDHCDAFLPQCILPLPGNDQEPSSSSPPHHQHPYYKGSSGRIAVLGGSAVYTGAPYYAATAALQTGADLVTVYTADEAATPLKAYSPELMVQPVYAARRFDDALTAIATSSTSSSSAPLSVEEVPEWLERLPDARQQVEHMVQTVSRDVGRYHGWVVGPGLGRCPLVGYATAQILLHVRRTYPNVPVVLDADALWWVSQSPTLWRQGVVRGNPQIILTPNRMEWNRLVAASENENATAWAEAATIVQKGAMDAVGMGLAPTRVYECTEVGGRKRSGGIGDVLAGTTATLAAWQFILQQRKNASAEQSSSWIPAAWTACHLVKRATRQAWQVKKRAMTAPNVLEQLGSVYEDMIGSDYK